MDMESPLNAYKRLEADKLFLENLMIGGSIGGIVLPYNADLIRARQLYLRSYTLTRSDKKTLTQKARLFLIKERNYLQMKIAMIVSLFSSQLSNMKSKVP